MNTFYSKFALVSSATLCLGLFALSAAEEEAAPLFVLPAGETETTAGEVEKSAQAVEGGSGLSDPAEEEAAVGVEDGGILHVLPDFVVSTEKDVGYYSAHSLSGTRTSALIKDTPMTIDVVNQELLDDLDLREINDLSEVLAGVDVDTTSEFNNRSITMRGLRTTSQFFEFMPRRLNANGYNRGRVEVIRGSNSLVYGQAAPGGKLNLLAKRAEFKKDSKTITASAGSYNNYQTKVDINKVVNDQIAVRFMGVHSESDSFFEGRRTEFDGLTLETTYRPTDKTEVRLHLETVDQARRGSSSLLSDQTRFGDTGTLDSSPVASEFVDFLPDAVINDIINHRTGTYDPGNASRDSVPDFFETKQDIKDFYDAIALDWDQVGIFAGENPYTDSSGHFILGDVTHHFMDNLVLKVAAAQDHGHREKFTRSSTGNVRLAAGSNANNIRYNESGGTPTDLGDPDVDAILSGASVSTRLSKDIQDDDTNSLRSTLSWQTEVGSSKQQFIFGFDFDRHTIEQETWSHYEDGTRLNFLGENGAILDGATRFDPQVYRLDGSNWTSLDLDDSVGEFLTTRVRDYQIDTTAGWIANSGSYLNGRLNTLAGVRFDLIESNVRQDGFTFDSKDSSALKGYGTGDTVENEYTQWSPTLGALYWFNSNIAIFANYSKSIESPSGFQFNVFGDLVPPQYGEGTEVGFKFEALDGKLNGAVMAFQIEKENHASSVGKDELEAIYPFSEYPELYYAEGDENFVGTDEPGAVVEVQGIEATIYYNPTRELSFILGYAFLDTEKTAIPEGATEGLGEKLEGTTPHSATLTASYKFNDGFLDGVSIGTNFKYKSASLYDTVSTTSEGRKEIWLSDNLEQSLFLGYSTKLGKSKRSPKLKLRFQVKNIWDSKDLVAGSNLRGNAKANFTKPRAYNVSASVSF